MIEQHSNTEKIEKTEAYQRGLADAQDWQVPHLNPYVPRTDSWYAWAAGYDAGRTITNKE